MPMWRVLRGTHTVQALRKEKVKGYDEDGNEVIKTRLTDEPKTYGPGQVFSTDENMEKYNGQGMTPKFVRIDDLGHTVAGEYVPPEYRKRPTESLDEFIARLQRVKETEETKARVQATPLDERRQQAMDDQRGGPTIREAFTIAPPAPEGPVPPMVHRRLKVDLDSMPVEALREYAAENEIELGGATGKDDIIMAIRTNDPAHLGGST